MTARARARSVGLALLADVFDALVDVLSPLRHVLPEASLGGFVSAPCLGLAAGERILGPRENGAFVNVRRGRISIGKVVDLGLEPLVESCGEAPLERGDPIPGDFRR